MGNVVPVEVFAEKIFEIRNLKVMIGFDLAALYNVPTRALNQAVKRNIARFPEDFMFQISPNERTQLVTTCDRLTNMRHSATLPYAFTEGGVAMLSSVLNSERAALINVQIVRASIRLRRLLIDHDALRLAIEGLERRVGKNERDIQLAIGAIQSILAPPQAPQKKIRIGFCPPEKMS